MYIISNFAKWKQLNEGLFWDITETEPIAGTNHKIKVKYLDGNSFKIKAVNDRDMVNSDGTIDPTLMDGIVAFLKGHDLTNFSREYPALQDLATFYKDSFFTYNVKKETDNKQVIVFSIQKRASFKGVTPETKILSDDAAAKLTQAPDAKAVLANSDKSLLTSTAEAPATAAATAAGMVKLAAPVLIADLSKLTAEMPMFKAIDALVAGLATSKVFTDKKVLELINKSADELEASKIGDSTVLLVKGIIAGLGLGTFTDKYGRAKPRTQITQEVVDKILALAPAPSAEVTAQNSSRNRKFTGKRINEQTAPVTPAPVTPALPANFKMEDFLKAIGGGEVTTGDIKLPDGGIKKATAAKGDAVLKQVQQLIIDKFSDGMATNPTFIKFKGYGADGDYGPTTEAMIELAKIACDLKDEDGTVITSELVNKLQTGNKKIVESYLGLRGQLVERLVEQFNFAAANARSSGKVSTGNQGTVDKKKEAPASSQHDWSKFGCLTNKDGAIEKKSVNAEWTMYTLKTKWTDLIFWNDGEFTTVAAYDNAKAKTLDVPFLKSDTKLDSKFLVTSGTGTNLKWNCTNIDEIVTAKDFAGVVAACGSAPAKNAASLGLNEIASAKVTTSGIEFVAGLVATAIDLIGPDWGAKHLEWLKSQLASLNALGGKFPIAQMVFNPDNYSNWSDIFTSYIDPLTGGDATLKTKIATTRLKAVGSVKNSDQVKLILAAIAVKNDETIISSTDEKAIAGAFMMISPIYDKDKIEAVSKTLGNDDSGLTYLISEFSGTMVASYPSSTTTELHKEMLSIWTIGALGYDATIWGLDSKAFAAAKVAIKSSLVK